MCNPLFKFRLMAEWADRLGCPNLATGHYIRLEEREGKTYILTGDDAQKDQVVLPVAAGAGRVAAMPVPLGPIHQTAGA